MTTITWHADFATVHDPDDDTLSILTAAQSDPFVASGEPYARSGPAYPLAYPDTNQGPYPNPDAPEGWTGSWRCDIKTARAIQAALS